MKFAWDTQIDRGKEYGMPIPSVELSIHRKVQQLHHIMI